LWFENAVWYENIGTQEKPLMKLRGLILKTKFQGRFCHQGRALLSMKAANNDYSGPQEVPSDGILQNRQRRD